jgi:glycogen debranching enzyme
LLLRALVLLTGIVPLAGAGEPPAGPLVPRFELPKSGLSLEEKAHSGRFFAALGHRAAAFGYENEGLEAWVYPLKVLDDLRLSFRLEGYPLEIEGAQVLASVSVRPEATILVYSHAAFTVRQIVFAPLGEPGVVMLLDVDSALPMTLFGSFRPRLRLMWPAGSMTANAEWDGKAQAYFLTEETRRFVGVLGAPGAADLSLMPYQEEPRDAPLRFSLAVPSATARASFVPIVIAGSVKGKDEARASYERLLASARPLYESNVAHYKDLLERTVSVTTPDPRLDAAFSWARVGIDKGIVDNPFLGTGLVAGFRTSGESERPGYAWFFGRDALWTALATTSYGDLALTRAALEFLGAHQRADGKIPHEISQSASLVSWFEKYEYPWNSADATPLFVIAHGDLYRASGDREFLRRSWSKLLQAWRFTAATDTDGDGLVENTKFGHGWVEGGALYPPHEEIYQQGAWIEACRALEEMAEAMHDAPAAAAARERAERTRAALEKTFWLEEPGYYAFAKSKPREKPPEAEAGPNRPRRQARMEELAPGGLVDEDTVMPAVPALWGLLDPRRAQAEIDHLGSAALATDWGARLLSDRSRLYDPLSYHYGSVWPLFTGWASLAAYRYGRPAVGYQALMANALLTFQGALGSVTELLSGDHAAPFGRSSHHQVWSQAMVVTPLLRGLFGVEVRDAGRTLVVAPQLPPDWPAAEVRNVAAGDSRCDLSLERGPGRLSLGVTCRDGATPPSLVAAPAFARDARVRGVEVEGGALAPEISREGDVQRARVQLPPSRQARLEFLFDEGTEAWVPAEAPEAGAENRGLRLLRSGVEGDVLRLVVEGRPGGAETLMVRSPRRPGVADGVRVLAAGPGLWRLEVRFEDLDGGYVRRELRLPLT